MASVAPSRLSTAVDGLIAAATAVLRREGATLATYGLASGPLGYRPLREFLVSKLDRDAGISCSADEILITSGSLQAIDLVNGILLAPGDTVLIEQETYQGALTRLARLGVKAVGIPLDREGLRLDALSAALDDLKGRNRGAKSNDPRLMDLDDRFHETGSHGTGGLFVDSSFVVV